MLDLILFIGLVLVGIYFVSRSNKQKVDRHQEVDSSKLNELYEQEKEELKKLDKLKEEKNNLINQLNIIENQIKDKTQFNTSLQKLREEELDRIIKEKKEAAESLLKRELEDWARSAQEAASFNNKLEILKLQDKKNSENAKLEQLQNEVLKYESIQDSINQEILRSRKIKEQQDFYSIQLSQNSIEDIQYLISIISNFHNKETIYKLIWSEYLQRPFKEMLNRVLEGKEHKNVIYILQNQDTQEIYIGKTRGEVSKRWTEHIKASLNIGTISHARIHDALYMNWNRFSFNILEDVDLNSSLSEREQFYINFYKSNIYGYNIKSGG